MRIRSQRPVGLVCPKCQSDKFQKINADNFMSLWPHRYCTGCGTKYRLPLSKKGRIAFFVTGLVMMVASPIALYGVWKWLGLLGTVTGEIRTTRGAVYAIVLAILFIIVVPFACFYYAFAKD